MSIGARVAVLVAVLLSCVGGTAVARSSWTPPDHTIVKVTGTKNTGFGIHRYDGSALYPPTLSESLAECGEYRTRVKRVRCRVGVRTWYRDLHQIELAIRYARRR